MDDTTFILAYGTFAVAVVGVLLIVLTRGIDRKRYLRPVVYGMIFGGLCMILFFAGIFALLISGVITGYLLAREITSGWSQFRGGALNALLLESSFIIANISLLIIRSVSWFLTDLTQSMGRPVGHEELLFSLYGVTLMDTLFVVAVVGVGAVLGGMLRKLLKPRAQKPPDGSGEATSSGVEQQ